MAWCCRASALPDAPHHTTLPPQVHHHHAVSSLQPNHVWPVSAAHGTFVDAFHPLTLTPPQPFVLFLRALLLVSALRAALLTPLRAWTAAVTGSEPEWYALDYSQVGASAQRTADLLDVTA